MKRAILFPGQGSQVVGMGKQLAEAFASARMVFEEVDHALGQNLSQLIFSGPAEELMLTENAQPAIMASSIAVLTALEKEMGFRPAVFARFFAGHSLGEYTALCAARVISLADTARLLKLRGQAMQKAVPQGEGAMAALLGLALDKVKTVVAEAGSNGACVIANDNSPEQIVISGKKEAVEQVVEAAKAAGAKRAMMLAVSAPFHSPLMQPAAFAMEQALANVEMNTPTQPIVANVTATAVHVPEDIRKLLVDQVCAVVRWRESMQYLVKEGVTYAVELGTGTVLSGLMKRTEPGIETFAVATPADMEKFEKVNWL